MIIMKVNILLAVLLPAVIAAPQTAGGRKLLCTVDGEEVSFSENIARQTAKKAPAGIHPDSPSGYPTTFDNNEELNWGQEHCRTTGFGLVQFPILENGEVYEWGKEPKKDPGPCRIAYGALNKEYCGVMCHKTRADESSNNPYTKCKVA